MKIIPELNDKLIISILPLFLILPYSGCGASLKEAGVVRQADKDTTLQEHELILEDLNRRITHLENIVVKQGYALGKLASEIRKSKAEGLSVESGGVELGSISEARSEKISVVDESGDIPVSQGGKRPLLKIHGDQTDSQKGHSHSYVRKTDISAFIKEVRKLGNYVPLKITSTGASKVLSLTAGSYGGGSPAGDGDSRQEEVEGEDSQLPDPYELGLKKYKEGRWVDAVLYFDIYIRDGRDFSKVRNSCFLKAESLYQAGKVVEALGSFEAVVSRYPLWRRSVEAKFRIARCYEKLFDFDRALKIYEEIVRSYPASSMAKKSAARISLIKNGASK